jgi:hypothetical protein
MRVVIESRINYWLEESTRQEEEEEEEEELGGVQMVWNFTVLYCRISCCCSIVE